MAKDSKEKWIETGYELFAKEGPQGILVEQIARILNRNKSGFYHYFKTQENFLLELFNHHRKVAKDMAKEIECCQTLDPDYFMVVVKYKLCVLVQGQLDRKTSNPLYWAVITGVREIVDQPLLPLWRKSFRLPDDKILVLNHFNLFRSVFHAQVNAENLTYEFLHRMKTETSKVMTEIFRHSRWNGRNLKLHEMTLPKNTVRMESHSFHDDYPAISI